MIDARKKAETEATAVTVAAEAEKQAALDQADAIRTLASVEAAAAQIKAAGVREIGKANAEQVRFIPGICSPSQAMDAANYGLGYVKFFPAEPYNAYNIIKALASPLPHIKFCPTGGVNVVPFVAPLSQT